MTRPDSSRSEPAAFDLANPRAYRRWRDAKLRRRPRDLEALHCDIDDPRNLSAGEAVRLLDALAQGNFALYTTDPAMREADLLALCAKLGLRRLDHHYLAPASGVVRLCETTGEGGGFVPYTRRPLNWHTDGYYNAPSRMVRGFALHCIRPAQRGGVNSFVDHELAYIRVRDRDPRWITALSRADALSIPAHVTGDGERRPAVAGPVFALDADHRLGMRFTLRRRHVQWAQDPALDEARAFLQELLDARGEDVWQHRLAAGQGLVCANLLHCRDAFSDDPPAQGRLLLRARYLDAPDSPDRAARACGQTADALARA